MRPVRHDPTYPANKIKSKPVFLLNGPWPHWLAFAEDKLHRYQVKALVFKPTKDMLGVRLWVCIAILFNKNATKSDKTHLRKDFWRASTRTDQSNSCPLLNNARYDASKISP